MVHDIMLQVSGIDIHFPPSCRQFRSHTFLLDNGKNCEYETQTFVKLGFVEGEAVVLNLQRIVT